MPVADLPETPRRPPSALVQWLVLIALSAGIAAAFELAALPAALLIGPMIAAIAAGVRGATISVWRPAFNAAQSVVGCLIAASISMAVVPVILGRWPLFVGAVLATLAASSLLGFAISRWRILPGSTAVWGTTPGAASAMVLMAEAFGADARLVAFMQYLRVIVVSLAAALIARLWVDQHAVSEAVVWPPPVDVAAFATTVLVAAAGAALGRGLRLPAPWFLGSFLLGVLAHVVLGLPFDLPPWLLALSYALIGWTIGLNFTAEVLRHALRALPQVLADILALMAFCGMLAWLLTTVAGIDPLTAYLATSPGGMDTVAIVAVASKSVDISFVMALQLLRFLVVLLAGPPLARRLAGRAV